MVLAIELLIVRSIKFKLFFLFDTQSTSFTFVRSLLKFSVGPDLLVFLLKMSWILLGRGSSHLKSL